MKHTLTVDATDTPCEFWGYYILGKTARYFSHHFEGAHGYRMERVRETIQDYAENYGVDLKTLDSNVDKGPFVFAGVAVDEEYFAWEASALVGYPQTYEVQASAERFCREFARRLYGADGEREVIERLKVQDVTK